MNFKHFFIRLLSRISALFNALPSNIIDATKLAVELTENIKNFDDNNPAVTDLITALIPGEIDNKIVIWLRVQLPIILTALNLVNTSKATSDADVITSTAIQNIQQLQGNSRNAVLHGLAVLLAQEAVSALKGDFKWTDAVFVVEWYYQHKFKKVKENEI